MPVEVTWFAVDEAGHVARFFAWSDSDEHIPRDALYFVEGDEPEAPSGGWTRYVRGLGDHSYEREAAGTATLADLPGELAEEVARCRLPLRFAEAPFVPAAWLRQGGALPPAPSVEVDLPWPVRLVSAALGDDELFIHPGPTAILSGTPVEIWRGAAKQLVLTRQGSEMRVEFAIEPAWPAVDADEEGWSTTLRATAAVSEGVIEAWLRP